MRSMVYGVSARNPLMLAIAVAVMVVVAFLAVLVPVTRATRVNPVRVLRSE
jgi:ABC-type antimicrobial peptide transport system permease subunit